MKVWLLGSFRIDPERQCGASFPNPDPTSPVGRFVCTLDAEHEGPHVAHLSGGGASPAVPIAVAFEEETKR